MTDNQKRNIEILSETVGMMRGLVELSRQKRDSLIEGRIAPVLALQEAEESHLLRLRSLLVEVELMNSDGGLPLPALDDPDGAWDRMAEVRLAMPRLAAELANLTKINRGLLFSSMRYVTAMLGAMGTAGGYEENGTIVLQENSRTNLSGEV